VRVMRRVGTSLAHLYADDFDDASLLSVDLEPEKTSGTLDAFQQHAPIQCAPLLPLLPHAVRRKPLLSIWTRCREDIADLYRYDLYRLHGCGLGLRQRGRCCHFARARSSSHARCRHYAGSRSSSHARASRGAVRDAGQRRPRARHAEPAE
jgi:hypothetical protein